jgi:hypothetical protein
MYCLWIRNASAPPGIIGHCREGKSGRTGTGIISSTILKRVSLYKICLNTKVKGKGSGCL